MAKKRTKEIIPEKTPQKRGTDSYSYEKACNAAKNSGTPTYRFADEDRIALRSEWQHDDKKLPMAYFDFGYSAADIEQLCAAAKKHCTTQNEQLPSCANRVE